jgi:hypothetical protein
MPSHKKLLIKRKFHSMWGQAFCMIAVLFFTLSPLIHGLHLASCDHAHELYRPRHTLFTYLCCHGHECDSERTGSQGLVTSNSQEKAGKVHDPSTCPICQIFAQLIKGHWLSFSPPTFISHQKIKLKKPHQDQTLSDQPSFLNGYPRAPPSAC